MLKMQGLVQSIAFVIFFGMIPLTQFQIFDPSSTFSQSRSQPFKRKITIIVLSLKHNPYVYAHMVLGSLILGNDILSGNICG